MGEPKRIFAFAMIGLGAISLIGGVFGWRQVLYMSRMAWIARNFGEGFARVLCVIGGVLMIAGGVLVLMNVVPR